ncbi:hypothetical protein KUTeg_006889 [Tegillarca granosa]|uniref:Nuclear pore complex protein Nup205 n=1 Tax=Tegillarca granosa TaxID=220873 RepID=A0ABQ9FBM9_TEGGR|nr:hypothetical protein KUTeg_006889 [Tegillarca granosa]
MAAGMAVNSEARLWGPFKELEQTVETAIRKKMPDAIHDLEVALKRHKPDFISLLKNPPKNPLYRNAVKKSNKEGLPIQGQQSTQQYSTEFIQEALILSDLFDMSEIAAVELLVMGERKMPEFPGLTRGLVAILLYYDGRKCLVNSLRTLLQSREGRTWTMELTPELTNIITQFTDQLLIKDALVNKILELISSMDMVRELEKLQKDRAIGPPKHKHQVMEFYKFIKIHLAECLFCLASQQPLEKGDTLRLINYLKGDNSCNADGTLDTVSLCLLMTLLYCFDVSVLEQEDKEESVGNLPFLRDETYIPDIHKEIMSEQPWSNQGLKATAQLAWGLALRQLSQFYTPNGVNECCEDDEQLISYALENNVFHFLFHSVVPSQLDDFYLRKVHGLITDFIFFMPLKVKELRNRGEETARIAMSQTQNGLDTMSPSRGFEYLLKLIGELYRQDSLGLSLEYWCPQELPSVQESMYHYKPPQRQVSLNKFVRLAGDLLPPSLYIPYINMLTGLSSNQQSAHHCFDLLKTNGMGSGGPASSVSWNHIFTSLNQYYTSLRREMPTSAETSHVLRAPHSRGITAQEIEGLVAVLKLTKTIAEKNELCRVALCENQQWSAVVLFFGLVTCSVPPILKAELFHILAAFSKTSEIAASLWQTLEASQILPTIPTGSSTPAGGIQVELDEIESRNEEYPMTLGFLNLLNTLTDIPVPAGLGAGFRAPGFDPYLEFIEEGVFLKFASRGYKKPAEKWEIASSALEIMSKLLHDHEIIQEDFVDQLVELQTGGTVIASKSPGHILIIHMLNDSSLLRMILRNLDDIIKQLETYTDIPGKKALEKASLQCLNMIQYTLEKEDRFIDACRETGASIMVSSMDRLLLGINPRSGKADHLVNIAKYITFGSVLPDHALSAMKILYHVCHGAIIQTELVNLFTADESLKLELLHGFVECLEVGDPELPEKMILLNEEKGILGFKTCLHSILELLDRGAGTPSGPECIYDTPLLSELSYKLIYKLSANKDTSAATLRYLRTTRDFLFKHLHHLPFTQQQYGRTVINHQSWLLKTISIELRITSLNRQRSHTQRLMRLLLDDSAEDQTSVLQPIGADDTDTFSVDRFANTSIFNSTALSQSRPLRGKQTRRKLLTLLDSVDFTQQYPRPLALDFFDLSVIENVIKNAETKNKEDVIYCDVKELHRILMSELNNLQGTVMAAQRPRIVEEVESILKNVVLRNQVRQNLYAKQQSFDAWRQVTEVLLTSCPEDYLPKDVKQAILFELLQELLQKVADEDSLTELTAPVAGVILTLVANLRQCFVLEQSSPDDRTSKYLSLHENVATLGQTVAWGQSSGARTLFATSLQLVLKGLIDHVMRSSGGQQRVRANLYGALLYYLQISNKPSTDTPEEDSSHQGVGARLLADTDTEYEQLTKENVSTILSYGDSFMDTVCHDACDGHDVGRMLALSVLDTILSMDKFQQWLNFMSSKGYLQHLIDSVLHDDQQLQRLLSPNPELRVLYIYESKMSLLTRVAECTAGAQLLLQLGLTQRLAACTFFDMRPEMEGIREEQSLIDEEDFIPSSVSRYRHLLFASLKLCLAILTSLGIENMDAGNKILQFIFAHGEVFHSATDTSYSDLDTAGIEFRAQKSRINRQMIALFPKYCLSEKLTKQLKNLESQQIQEERDLKAEITLAYQEIAANVTSYCRTVVSTSEFSKSTISVTQAPNLGVVVYQLRTCASHFMAVYDSYQQHLRKLQTLSDLSTDDIKEFAGVNAAEKITSHQRQHLAKKRLTQIVNYKAKELQHFSYIIENCVFLLWRHLEYYLIHCIPVDQQPSLYQVHVRRQQQMRRLQDLTGAIDAYVSGQEEDYLPELDEINKAVTREMLAKNINKNNDDDDNNIDCKSENGIGAKFN